MCPHARRCLSPPDSAALGVRVGPSLNPPGVGQERSGCDPRPLERASGKAAITQPTTRAHPFNIAPHGSLAGDVPCAILLLHVEP